MNPLSAQQLAGILHASVVGDASALVTSGVSTDTRKLPDGCAFFALRGERFDGHAFARQALESGAAVSVVDHWDGDAPVRGAAVVVKDTLLALQQLACWWRHQLDIAVVAITGSSGKTSTKDFTSAVLRQQFKVSATFGNLNNHIGVPLTVLGTAADCTAAVWEMGMNHAGEIAPLCEIARPKFGIITNIGSAHIEFLGSREAIAEEKGALGRALPSDGFLFVPVGCDFYDYLRRRTRATVIPVGNGRGLVRAENVRIGDGDTRFDLIIDGLSSAEVHLRVGGRHMVSNALLAAGAGWKLGMDTEAIAAGLNSANLTGGRLKRFDWNGIAVYDDTYNANPESMAAAIETLAEMPLPAASRRVVVLGRMGELGSHAAEAHERIGKLAAARGMVVLAVGDGSQGIAESSGGTHLTEVADAAAWVTQEARPGDAILFKGSRSAAVERVMNLAFPRS